MELGIISLSDLAANPETGRPVDVMLDLPQPEAPVPADPIAGHMPEWTKRSTVGSLVRRSPTRRAADGAGRRSVLLPGAVDCV